MNSERILVSGGGGRLGRALAAHGCTALSRKELDICSPDQIADSFRKYGPGIVINAAAYTNVDKAESEPGFARAINADAPAHLAAMCTKQAIPLLHLSTDCVFADHTPDHPVDENTRTNPSSVYGRSKRDGESHVLAAGHTVIRVSWLFDDGPGTFIAKMLDIAQGRQTIKVVDDEYGRPTPVGDLAVWLIRLAKHVHQRQSCQVGQILHAGPPGPVSRFEWARRIFAASAALGGPAPDIDPIAAAHFRTPARRPRGLVLDTGRASRLVGPMPDWRPASAMAVKKQLASREIP